MIDMIVSRLSQLLGIPLKNMDVEKIIVEYGSKILLKSMEDKKFRDHITAVIKDEVSNLKK